MVLPGLALWEAVLNHKTKSLEEPNANPVRGLKAC